VDIYRNDDVEAAQVLADRPSHILMSPGPGTPKDSGVCQELSRLLVASGEIPTLGVCLGHQTLCETHGAVVQRAGRIMHGKLSAIEHDGQGIFAGIESPFDATRYHSLIVEESTLPSFFTACARTPAGELMGVRHEHLPIFGVQFHPESILSQHGHRMIETLARKENLDHEAAAAIFGEIMQGRCSPEQISALLMGLAVKGETSEEIHGAAKAMRAASTLVETKRRPLIDTCGTGGSGVPRRNVSTAVALAVAACGVGVAKHGNRAASSRSGSADVLEALGVDIDAPAETVAHCIDTCGVGFLFARNLHPAMRHAGPVRRALGVRTIFNLLGPMTNPAQVGRQVIGVFDPRRCEDMARALGAGGSERVFVVHGFRSGTAAVADAEPGIDDLSTEGESLVVEWKQGTDSELRTHRLKPEDAGLERAPIEELSGGDPQENADALRRLLAGEQGAYRMAVQYAGALALLVARDDDFNELDRLPALARQIGAALSDGSAATVLGRLVEASHWRPKA
jgi:anthranilate phosphoribosyltransferase